MSNASPLNLPSNSRPMRPRRSVLFVPAGNGRAMEKAPSLDCDAIIYDLEDSVAPEAKAAAREALRAGLASRTGGGKETIVRINALSTEWGTEDLLAARAIGVDAILLPKVGEPEDVQMAASALNETDAPPELRLWAMIETPKGLMNVGQIAHAAKTVGSRLDCFVIGPNDIAKETGVAPLPGRPYLVPWLMQVVLAARTFGFDVLDGVYNDFRDESGFAAECAQGRAMGFDGKTLIHPSQIRPANAAFGVPEESIAEAETIVRAFADPVNDGRGVIEIGGRMVERLHLAQAEKLLAKARLIGRA